MAGTIGDVVQVTFAQIATSATMLNVYYYMIEDAPTSTYLTGLLTDFQSIVLTAYAGTQVSGTVFQSLRAVNIFSGDLLEDSTLSPSTGSRSIGATDVSASFMAAQIRLVRGNTRVRNGRKAVYLPLETDYSGNTISAGTQTLLNTYAATLDDQLDPGGIDLFTPVIVGRLAYTTPSGREAYRLPVSQAEMGDNWSPIIGAIVPVRVSTMNSRKYWRGI